MRKSDLRWKRASRRIFAAAALAPAAAGMFLSFGCGPASTPPAPAKPSATSSTSDTTSDNDTFFRQSAAEWDRLFTAGDLAGLTALYAPDVVSMPYDTPTLQGRENEQSAFQQFFAENSAARHETTVDQIISTNDWAIERSRYKMTYTPKSTGKEVVETGRHIMCRKKMDGKCFGEGPYAEGWF